MTPRWNGSRWSLGGDPMTRTAFVRWYEKATPRMREATQRNLTRGSTLPLLPAGRSVAELRRRAKRLLAEPTRAQRTEALRRRASAVLGADDWRVIFKGRGKLTRLENERSRMGFELFGDPSAFRR
ncbi:MAG TPA: hypothetical protein VND88_04065 [Candidatus Acidoferrales bacterium]|nr:hypothetical protein [Candidatus Acidoferrales bacterium]